MNYNNMQRANTLTYGDRIISALTYLSGGFIGFLWLIFLYIKKQGVKPFVRFHIYQSIFISILYQVFMIVAGILLSFLKIIPIIGAIVFYIAQMTIILGYSLPGLFISAVVLYLVLTAIAGKYSQLPWVSDTVRKLM